MGVPRISAELNRYATYRAKLQTLHGTCLYPPRHLHRSDAMTGWMMIIQWSQNRTELITLIAEATMINFYIVCIVSIVCIANNALEKIHYCSLNAFSLQGNLREKASAPDGKNRCDDDILSESQFNRQPPAENPPIATPPVIYVHITWTLPFICTCCTVWEANRKRFK